MPIPLFDSHSDTVHVARARGRKLRENDMQLDFRRSAAFAPRGQVFSIWGDPKRDPPMFDAVIAYWEAEIAENAAEAAGIDAAEAGTTAETGAETAAETDAEAAPETPEEPTPEE